MARQFYLDQAAKGLCMPVGTDLVLHRKADPAAILLDGPRLGEVMAETAHHFNTPLAIPLMDLTVEKATILEILGVPSTEIDKYHFTSAPSAEQMAKLDAGLKNPANQRLLANNAAITQVATKHPDLIPVGMCIGPFSLMTKLVADPITGVYMGGMGTSAEEDDEVKLVETALVIAERAIAGSLHLQAKAGAKIIFMCEPAANTVYISPQQVEDGSDVFERYVMAPNLRLKKLIDELGMDLLLHDCGALTPTFIKKLTALRPVVLSLGSPVNLWEAAAVVPKDIVLFGNLPSKKFFSDTNLSDAQVREMTQMLVTEMQKTGHPFILGSECDILSVPNCEESINRKVSAFLDEGRRLRSGCACGCTANA